MSQATHKPPKADTPIEAFRFAADFSPAEKAADGTVPFTVLARTVNAVEHWFWGSCVHDFAGMSAAPVITVDYNHCDDEALGLINTTAVTPEGLQCSGILTPFLPDDKASEVIFKSGKGVPYQASIYFDPWSCVVEDVPAGFSTEVNGTTLNGPVAVFRQWELLRLAVCLSGVDGGTSVGFSKNLSGKTIAVTRFKKGEEMPQAKKSGKFAEETEEEKKKREEAEAAAKESESTTESDTTETATEDTEAEETEEEKKKRESASSNSQLSRKELGKKFIATFGEQHGPTLFAAGLELADAHVEYAKILKTENEAIRAENAKFAKQGSNGTTPVSFGGGGKPAVPSKFAHLGNAGRLAAGIKLPK